MEFGQKLSFQKACFCTSVRCFLSKNHLAWRCIFWTGLSHHLDALPSMAAVPRNPSLPKCSFHCQNISIIDYQTLCIYIKKHPLPQQTAQSLCMCVTGITTIKGACLGSQHNLCWSPSDGCYPGEITVSCLGWELLWYSTDSTNYTLEGLHQIGKSVIPLQCWQGSQCCLRKLPGKEGF